MYTAILKKIFALKENVGKKIPIWSQPSGLKFLVMWYMKKCSFYFTA